MFAGTPRIRDLLDVRTAAVIAIVAVLAFGLQLGALAGLFASPLGDAVARLDGVAPARGTQVEALAAAAREGPVLREVAGDAKLVQGRRPAAVAARPTVPARCVARGD